MGKYIQGTDERKRYSEHQISTITSNLKLARNGIEMNNPEEALKHLNEAIGELGYLEYFLQQCGISY